MCSSGVQVKRYEAHRSRVNDLSFDERAEHVASCSDDGSVVVSRAAAARPHACLAYYAAVLCTALGIQTQRPRGQHQTGGGGCSCCYERPCRR